jgi:BRCA1-associated protein
VHLYREGGGGGGTTEHAHVRQGDYKAKGLPPEEDGEGGGGSSTILCIPAVPSYLSPSDFLGFVGETWRRGVSHYRMVMTSRMNRYMVLMKFRDSDRATEWRKEFDGKVFNSMEVRPYFSPPYAPGFLDSSTSCITDFEGSFGFDHLLETFVR